LQQREVDGRTYWFPAAALRPRTDVSGVIDLIQAYEEVAISYTESRDALLGKHGRLASATDRPHFMNTILLDGQVIGHWRPVQAKGEVRVDSFFYRRLRPPEKQAMDRAVKRYGEFMELPASWAPATRGA
jgi:hypothetical protein